QALVAAGFLRPERRSEAALEGIHTQVVPMRRVLAGFATVLACFAVAAVANEASSRSEREVRARGETPLELLPEGGGGLRVLATPWAHVRVDGQEVETTPFARPIPLAPGKHFVTLVHPEASPVEREIDVGPEEIVT